MKPEKHHKRYAAKLLFQFRVTVAGGYNKMRLCEERIILLKAPSAKAALAKAKRRGRASQSSYKNSYGNTVQFEYIGVMDLLCLDTACEDNEVWYGLTRRLLPLERKAKLIPPESELN